MAHGDDFLCTGPDHHVQEYIEKTKGIFEVKVTVVGPKDSQPTEFAMVGRGEASRGKPIPDKFGGL